MKTKPVVLSLAALAAVAAGVFGVTYLTKDNNKSSSALKTQDAQSQLNTMVKKIDVYEGTSKPLALTGEESAALDELLPDLPEEYEVNGDGDVNLIVWSSPEKAGSDQESWLKDQAVSFNNGDYTTSDGSSVSVSLRSISSGLANDYIASGKALPDLYTPSSAIWQKMLESEGVELECLDEKLVGNCAGLFVSKDACDKLKQESADLNLESIVNAVMEDKISMGYTNPYTSTTGLNFLGALSAAGISFEDFQSHIPYVATTSNQMVKSAGKGTFDVFVGESQQYYASPAFQNNYTFIPFGTRHDNPLYGLSLNENKKEAADLFVQKLKEEPALKAASQKYFNQSEDYAGIDALDGQAYIGLQDMWKQEKDSGKTVAAFFIADTSGSMDGAPLLSLQESLLKTMQEISDSSYIGLISYSDPVVVEMPLRQFDINAKAAFKGAVSSMQAAGNTYTYEAVLTALHQIVQFEQAHPDLDIAPKLILLSDGEANGDQTLDDIRDIVAGMKIPVYTVGYNYTNNSLNELSDLTESASLNADTDDVITRLRDLFRINL